MQTQGQVSSLNMLEFHFLAMDMANLGMIRFRQPHSVDEMRRAVRYLLSVFPRLRSVLEPTPFSYQLRVIDDQDPRLEVLFAQSFRIRHDVVYGTPAYEAYWREVFNEPFALQKELPIRFVYLPDDPEPTILMLVHHMILDALGSAIMVNTLMEYLNDKPRPAFPVDDPSLAPILLEQPWSKVPAQLWRSYKVFAEEARQNRGEKIVPVTTRPSTYIAQTDAIYHTLTPELATIKAKSKALGCTVSVFLLTVLATTISRGPTRDQGDVIVIPVQVDMRSNYGEKMPVLGNFFFPPILRVHRRYWDKPLEMIAELRRQMDERRAQITRRDILFPALMTKLNTLMGVKLYSRQMRRLKAKYPAMKSCIFSNPGTAADLVNMHGAKATARIVSATTMPDCLLLLAYSFEQRLHIGFTYPEAEFTRDEMRQFIQSYEQVLGELLQL